MGAFSWMFADKRNKQALKIMGHGFVACPDGSFIEETSYDGYGHFAGHDIYDLVVDWNRDWLNTSMLQKPVREMYAAGDEGDIWFNKGCKNFERAAARLMDWRSGEMNEEEMALRYGQEWKRDIGIDIACYDDQNAALPYPIKIVSERSYLYHQLPASQGDEHQGW